MTFSENYCLNCGEPVRTDVRLVRRVFVVQPQSAKKGTSRLMLYSPRFRRTGSTHGIDARARLLVVC